MNKNSVIKLTGFMIALVLISLFAAVFGLFLTEFNDQYPAQYNVSSDNRSLEVYNKMDSLSNISGDVKRNVTSISQPQGILDTIGAMFSSGYNALLLIPKSFDLFNNMADQAIQDAGLGAYGILIKTALITIVVILIFIGVILSVLVKREL